MCEGTSENGKIISMQHAFNKSHSITAWGGRADERRIDGETRAFLGYTETGHNDLTPPGVHRNRS
jgi:hypothetical protein